MNNFVLLKELIEYQKGYGLTVKTVRRNEYLLTRFLKWLDNKDIREVSRETIYDYKEYLASYRSRYTKKLLKPVSIGLEMSVLKGFFDYLIRHEKILINPMEGMRIKARDNLKQRKAFSEEDIAAFLDSIEEPRDRALFELMYSSGLRVSEVLNLEMEHLDLEGRTLLVKRGKGKKDRYVPFSVTAQAFLVRYLTGERKRRARRTRNEEAKRHVFMGWGKRLDYSRLSTRFKKYLQDCGLDKKEYTIHSIRHATGTHLLSHGASIRYVQELLGHENLQTTQLYTHPSDENIKAVYRTYHPRENEYFKDLDPEYVEELRKLKELLGGGGKDIVLPHPKF